MKISLIQRSIEWLDSASNREEAQGWIAKSEGASLCLFSEMFSTGFSLEPKRSSVEWTKTLDWMKRVAKEHHTAIGGSVAVEEGGKFYNRLYIAMSDGAVHHYDKRHLFTFAGEDKHYTRGEQRVVITLGGVRILPLLCYDLRFPVWSRNRGDYDVIIYLAAWPESRRMAWDTLLRARAIENVSYVCGVNIIGSDPMCHYSGGTAAIDFMGNTICKVDDGQSGIAMVDIDLEALNAFREKFAVLSDGDNFEIK